MTFAQLAATWLAEYVPTKRPDPRDQRLARQRMNDYAVPALGCLELAKIKPADLYRLRGELDQRELSPRSVRHVLADVKCALAYARDSLEVIDRSPWTNRVLPAIQEDAPRSLTATELAATLEACPPAKRPLVRFLLATGLRWGELCALRWDDVTLGEEPYLTVRGSHEKRATKGRKVRIVPLLPQALEVLAELPQAGPYVFQGRRRGMLGRHPASHFRAIRAALPGFTVHRLRHTYVTGLLEDGVHPRAVQTMAGHARLETTLGYSGMRASNLFTALRRAGVVG